MHYYWVSGGDGRVVTYTATIGNKQFSAHTTLDVKRPVADITTQTAINAIYVDYNNYQQVPNTWHIHFGGCISTPYIPGITFTYTLGAGSFPDCELAWAQTINSGYKRYILGGGTDWTQKNMLPGCDNRFPYDEAFLYDPTNVDHPTEDAPGSPLTPYLYERKITTEDFSMYLMFQPSGGIWVPLRKVNWTWTGDATKNGGGYIKTNSGSYSQNPGDEDCISPPEWGRLARFEDQ